jgi:AcrR family transcriptional regulator
MTSGHQKVAMPTAKRRRLQPEARRGEIISAAEKLLRRDGPGVRVEDVVREAGAAKGTFYLYFATWDDLLVALRSRIVAQFDTANPTPPARDTDWAAFLDQQVTAFADAAVAMGALHEVLYHSDFAVRWPPPVEEDAVARFVDIVEAGQRAGVFGAIDAVPTARLLFGAIHQAVDLIAAGADRDRTLTALKSILRRSLGVGD